MDTLSLPLIKPVKLGELTFDKLELREPTAGEIEKAASASNDVGMMINLISAVAATPRTVVAQLCQRDFQAATSFLQQFNDAGQETGETSSQS